MKKLIISIFVVMFFSGFAYAGEKEELRLQRAFYLQTIRACDAESELARTKIQLIDRKLEEMKKAEEKAKSEGDAKTNPPNK